MNYRNFAFKLTSDQLEQIIQDNQLLSKNYSFKYAIDTYDIINYCLPYTDNIFSNPKNRNYFAQRIIAYSDFFRTNTAKTYICKEYQEELKNVTENILANHNSLFSELAENMKSILLLFRTDAAIPDAEYVKLVKHNLELVVTLLILDQEYSADSKERNNFIKENFKGFKLENPHYTGNDIILNKLLETSENPLVPVVFKSFVDDIAFHLMDVSSRVSRYHYLETTYSDIEVICKISEINRSLNEENSNIVVVYLSSAPKKTNQIFTILNRISGDGIGLPEIDDFENFNFHRNIFQVFLLKALKERYPDNALSVESALYLIKKIVFQIETTKQSPQVSETELENTILSRLSKDEKNDFISVKIILENISADIENHFYYDRFTELLTNMNYGNQDKEKLKLLTLASTIVKEEEASLSNVSSLVNYLTQFTNTQTLLHWLYKADDLNLKIRHGHDIIRNDFNHLPYLVFYIQRNSDLAMEMYNISSLVSLGGDISDYRESIIESFKKAFYIIDFSSGDSDEKVNAAIVTSWINLISSPKKEMTGGGVNEMTEEHIISFLYRFIQVHQSINLSPALQEKNNTLKLIFKRDDTNADIGYILLWLLRRNLRFSECSDLGAELMRLYPEDPRMCHGVALNYISEFYYNNKKKTGLDLYDLNNEELFFINQSVKLLNKSLEGYQKEYQNTNTNESFRNLVAKSILSIQNSIIDMSLRLYILEKDIQILVDARKYLNSMKENFADYELEYNTYTIPNYTEAELEYLEALYYFEKNDLTNASVKILHATNRAYQIKEKHTNMDESFKGIIHDIDRLRVVIFKALRII